LAGFAMVHDEQRRVEPIATPGALHQAGVAMEMKEHVELLVALEAFARRHHDRAPSRDKALGFGHVRPGAIEAVDVNGRCRERVRFLVLREGLAAYAAEGQ